MEFHREEAKSAKASLRTLADFVACADYLFASAAHIADPVAAATAWFAAGPAQLVVLGMGPRGAMLVRRNADGAPEVLQQPPPPSVELPIVDTTGAGDALATGVLDGLRVVDASVFPLIPGFFVVSAVYMIGEKAADAILRDARGQ